MSRVVAWLVRFFLRFMPDAFVVAALLTLLTFALAVGVSGYGVGDTLQAWGDGFWDLLTFTNQITLTLLLGYALANTPPVRRGLARIAGRIRTPTAAYTVACLASASMALVSWGLCLVGAGILSRSMGAACRRRGVRVHYPLLVASAFAGFVVWHQGLSSSIGLILATPGHFLEERVGIVATSETLFTAWNLGLAAFVVATLPWVMNALRPGDAEVREIPEQLAIRDDVEAPDGPAQDAAAAPTPAQRLEGSRALNLLVVAAGLAFLWSHFVTRGEGLTLNAFNFVFLMAGMLLAGSLHRYVQIVVEGGRVAAPFLLQYPFYAGIAGVMADSGLAQQVVDVFVSVSSAASLPFYALLSSGLLNIFIPSGGGQWAVQGPIMMEAALALDADLPRVAMAVALGDQWTNLVQPLAIVPVITIARVPLREMMGYTFVALLYSGAVFSAALLLF